MRSRRSWGGGSSIINNPMLFQVAVRARLFLSERMAGRQVMILAALRTLAAQIRRQ